MSRARYRQLIDFAAGERGPRSAEIEAHLDTHPAAAATVALYRLAGATMAGDDGIDPSAAALASARAIFTPKRADSAVGSLADHLTRVLGRLIFDSRVEPALAGLRGPACGFQLTYELPDAQLDLHAEPAEAPGRWRLIGQFACSGSVPAMTIDLHRAGSDEPIRTVEAGERGVFVLDTGPGLYELRLHLPEATVVIPEIDIS